MEEITYSWLVDKICTKMKIDESTMKLKLSYIPTGVKPPTYLYIRDDDDVYVYLTTLDEEKSRSVLHVEVGNELEMVDVNEQQSRVQRKSSVGVNYEEENFGGLDNDDRANVGAITLYANEPLGEQLAEPLETLEPLQPLEPLRDVDNGVDSNLSMTKENDVAQKLPVIELNTYELQYSVIGRDGKTYVVDLRNKSCYCRCFDLDKYPCVHAIAAVMTHLKQKDRSEEVKSLYDLITKYYFVEMWVMAYVRTIYPVPHKSEWVIPSEIQELFAYPPVHVVKKGRVQETRHPSVGERRPKNKRVKGRNLES
ncbi:unnamed protein product [Arabidopsis thaliana]|uniref:(thale cress) hypothetical protein n=1 Tax=Arabidopsis thaliana TaxID=3702 RepID=A0A7G2E8S9_ARATH|nr:unnamed protein product [Arabidopsis thaliana]